jgi:tetratricopeptide (TPR) repeat protein
VTVFSFRAVGLAAALATSTILAPATTHAETPSGAYLAARIASFNGDYRAAADYYLEALISDPSNVLILENATLALAGLGDFTRAGALAKRLEQLSVDSQLARIINVAALVERDAVDRVVADMDAGLSIGPLVDNLLRAWAYFYQGQMSDALTMFDETAEMPGMRGFAVYHKALALASVGDFEGAEALFADPENRVLRASRRGVLANVQILSQLERNADAVALIDEVFGTELDPGTAVLRARLEAGDTLPFTVITSGRDGLAEVFYTVAGALNGEASDAFTLVYSRTAEFLRPDHVDSLLLSAALLEQLGQHALATEVYLKVPADDPAFYVAEIGRAGSLDAAGRPDAATEVLTQLAKAHPEVPVVHVTLGDHYSRQEDWQNAIAAYDKAVGLFSVEERGQWVVYYARAIAHERLGNWDKAEPDFLRALDLEPDQPRVLNYLGYSYVEKQEKLDVALDMIERAVAARPDSGYIVDSLGWVLYRLGRYEEAVPHMERAVELMPVDPVVNDHLGDVLWAVGRKVEAEFQWKRALSFVDPDDVPTDLDPDRVRRKLDVGLDVVRSEEGADPISVADGN